MDDLCEFDMKGFGEGELISEPFVVCVPYDPYCSGVWEEEDYSHYGKEVNQDIFSRIIARDWSNNDCSNIHHQLDKYHNQVLSHLIVLCLLNLPLNKLLL